MFKDRAFQPIDPPTLANETWRPHYTPSVTGTACPNRIRHTSHSIVVNRSIDGLRQCALQSLNERAQGSADLRQHIKDFSSIRPLQGHLGLLTRYLNAVAYNAPLNMLKKLLIITDVRISIIIYNPFNIMLIVLRMILLL